MIWSVHKWTTKFHVSGFLRCQDRLPDFDSEMSWFIRTTTHTYMNLCKLCIIFLNQCLLKFLGPKKKSNCSKFRAVLHLFTSASSIIIYTWYTWYQVETSILLFMLNSRHQAKCWYCWLHHILSKMSLWSFTKHVSSAYIFKFKHWSTGDCSWVRSFQGQSHLKLYCINSPRKPCHTNGCFL